MPEEYKRRVFQVVPLTDAEALPEGTIIQFRQKLPEEEPEVLSEQTVPAGKTWIVTATIRCHENDA